MRTDPTGCITDGTPAITEVPGKNNKKMITVKTKEELKALKEEVEALNIKLAELTEEELAEVVGGLAPGRRYWPYSPAEDAIPFPVSPEQ